MSEQRIPQGGLPRPRPKHHPLTAATHMQESITRQRDGTYRLNYWKEDRYCRPMQIGATQICVMDDFGFLVTLWSEGYPWH